MVLIFTDGEKLYGFNGVNDMVFTIDAAEDGLAYTDVATLNAAGLQSYINPIDVTIAGKWLLWHEVDQNTSPRRNRLLAFNLETGTVKQAVIGDLQMISAYKDGQLLTVGLSERDRARYTVYTYDPETDKVTSLGQLPKGVILKDVQYSAALDLLVYADGTSIMGWHPETGAELLGYSPTTYANVIAVTGDSLVYAEARNVEARSIAKGYAPEHSLRVMNGNLQTSAKELAKVYPEVPVYYEVAKGTTYMDSGEDYAAILAREKDAPDLLKLTVRDGDLQGLMEGGYLLDLSAYPALKAYADALYPVYQELVTKDGGIYALPVFADSYNGWFINKKVMQEMGLTAEDIPVSLTEMCAFATRWNDEYAEKYPHYTLLNNTTGYRERLLEAILIAWSDYCQSVGKAFTFDDPILREALSALDAAKLDKLDAGLHQTNPEVSEYKQALIWTGCKTVGNWATYMEDYSDRIFIPLTLTQDTPYVAAVENVAVWGVNAKTQNAQYAAALLAEAVSSLSFTHSYVLRSDKKEPIISEYYAESLAYEQEKLAALEARLEQSVNRAAIEKRIEEQKAYIENELLRDAYSAAPSAIKNYAEVIQPASFIDMPDGFTDRYREEDITGLINRYVDGTLSMEAFIKRMDEALAQ